MAEKELTVCFSILSLTWKKVFTFVCCFNDFLMDVNIVEYLEEKSNTTALQRPHSVLKNREPNNLEEVISWICSEMVEIKTAYSANMT